MKNKSLTPYIKLVEFLGEVLGPDYEISLQDVNNSSHATIAIENGYITGRTLGSPLTEYALQIIAEKKYQESGYHVSYNAMSKDHKLLRSSTFFIMDEKKLIGLLCINFDSSKYLEISKEILRLCHPDSLVESNYNFSPLASQVDITETFTGSIPELITSIMEKIVPGENVAPNRLSKEEKLQIVVELEKKGVFMVKGAVNQVAQQLCSSPASIYRYLKSL